MAVATSPSVLNKLFGLTVAFLLNFRIVHNLSEQALVLLLKFFKYIFLLIGTAFGVPELKTKFYFPQSLHGCYSYMNVSSNSCKEYIVCPGCNMLYNESMQSLYWEHQQTLN